MSRDPKNSEIVTVDEMELWVAAGLIPAPTRPEHVVSPVTGYRWRLTWPKS